MRQRETKGQSLCLIRIGAGETRAAHLLTDAFVEMHRVHPGVAIELFTGNADTVEERLERGLLDFALVIEPVNVDKYEWLRMPKSGHSGVAVGAGSEWARLDAVTPEVLARMPLLVSSRTSNRTGLMQNGTREKARQATRRKHGIQGARDQALLVQKVR